MYWTYTMDKLYAESMDAMQMPTRQLADVIPDDLELLIAKYTLEYLWRWSNDFDPASLTRIRTLLAKAETPQDIARAFRRFGGPLPN